MIACSYNNCFIDKTNHPDVSFFKFPISDLELLQSWMTKCGNSNLLDCSLNELNTKYICEKHFPPESIHVKVKDNERSVKVLKKYFAPIQYQEDEKPDPLQFTAENSTDDIQVIVEDEENENDGKTECIIISLDNSESDKEIDLEELILDPKIEIKREILDVEEPMVQGELDEDNKDGVIEEGLTQNVLCYVPNCKVMAGKSMEEIFYFKPPSDDKNMFKIWDICIGRKDRRLSKEDRVCQSHFSDGDLVKKVKIITKGERVFDPVENVCLKNGAVPCITFQKECCVPECGNKTGRMYCFPVLRDSEFHLWLYLIKNPILKNFKMRDVLQYRVCENHFEHDSFDKDFKLTHSAAPTLCLPDVYPLIESDASLAPRQYSQLLVGKCIYKGCSYTRNQKYLFKFPTEPDRCVNWLRACGRSELITTPKETAQIMNSRKLGICQYHFDINEFTANISKLKPTAVPKLYSSKPIKIEPKVNPAEGTSYFFPSNSNEHLKYRVVKIAGVQGSIPNKISGKETLTTSVSPKKVRSVCIYKDCQNRVTVANSFPFPTETHMAERWLQACGLGNRKVSDKRDIVEKAKVCSRHFDQKQIYNGTFLRLNAIPVPLAYEEKKTAEIDNIDLTDTAESQNETTPVPQIVSTHRQQNVSRIQRQNMFRIPPQNVTTVQPQNVTTVQPQNMRTIQSQNMAAVEAQSGTTFENNSTSETRNDAEGLEKLLKGPSCRKIRKCAALLCSVSLQPPEIFHNFPDPNKEKERFSMWMQLLIGSYGSNDSLHQTIFEDFAVCNKHFHEAMFKKDTWELLPDAVPTLHLSTTHHWLFKTDYFKKRIKPLFIDNYLTKEKVAANLKPSTKTDATNCTTLVNAKRFKRCVLEEDRINFPDLGTHLYTGHGETSQSGIKRPYGIFRYFNEKYGLDGDIHLGENVMIHTAIIIDDDDVCEKRVLRQLLENNMEHCTFVKE